MLNEKEIQQAIDRRLSGLGASEARRMRIRSAVNATRREERPVKKKFSIAIALAIAIMMMASVAVAASLGLFGQLAGSFEDGRLADLDAASTYIHKTFAVQRGAALTIDQAYYDGSRVFISYRMDACADEIDMGAGVPDVANWSSIEEGCIMAEQYHSEDPAAQAMNQYLDGSEPRWARVQSVSPHDCLEALVDGEYVTLMIIGGDSVYHADGAITGWKECEVPEELRGEKELTVCFGVFTSDTTYYQEGSTLCTSRAASGRDTTQYYPFTVQRDDANVRFTGSAATEDWSATADIALSKVDLRGTVTVQCPESWIGEWGGWPMLLSGEDIINEWAVYVNGAPVEGYNLAGSTHIIDSTTIQFSLCYRHVEPTAQITLVPCYDCIHEHPEEAMTLNIAE